MSFVLDAVARHATERRDAIALTDDRDELTYEALWRESEEWAATLRGLLEHPPTIATCLENSALWVLLDLALIRLRSPTLPLPLFFTDAQRRHALAQSGATILVADHSMVGYGIPRVLELFGRALYLHRIDAPPAALPTDTAKITYTSGTTGQSKGVCLSQAALESVARGLVEVSRLRIDGERFGGRRQRSRTQSTRVRR
jgi:long-chain acyl-CoA synthetase